MASLIFWDINFWNLTDFWEKKHGYYPIINGYYPVIPGYYPDILGYYPCLRGQRSFPILLIYWRSKIRVSQKSAMFWFNHNIAKFLSGHPVDMLTFSCIFLFDYIFRLWNCSEEWMELKRSFYLWLILST